jgi:pilus assembly protein TadC
MSTKTPRATKAPFTKEEGIKAYGNNPAAKWIKFAFKYFSKSTEKENMKPSKAIVTILLVLFLSGFLATVLKLPRSIIGPITYAYAGILSVLVLFLLAAVTANNRRIKKVVKELGCSIEEWNKFVDVYGDELK